MGYNGSMKNQCLLRHEGSIRPFDRDFYGLEQEFTFIGNGAIGGKANGLANIREKIVSHYTENPVGSIQVNIPRLTVITTQFFDLFMERNNLYPIALSDASDDRIAHHFLKAEIPTRLTGDLRALVQHIHLPLAIRSSSLLEDRADSPFAGIYETKMIPNNQHDIDLRFRKLSEAIKFVYASTFFKNAKNYIAATPHNIRDEKMAVIIQEVVGLPHNKRFYPNISGVARSYNYYPPECAKPQDGVVSLALGLGKSIVDGGSTWTYSPQYPEVPPPYNSINHMMKETQLNFWAVNMAPLTKYHPFKETEYLVQLNLSDAEYDNTLSHIASTYDCQSQSIRMGISSPGPRLLDFASMLQVNTIPLNRQIKSILQLCEETFDTQVEIEFAVIITPRPTQSVRFSLLQVRPLALSTETVDIKLEEATAETVFAASTRVMGNGTVEDIRDIVYVDPQTFQFKNSWDIAAEIATINTYFYNQNKHYLLIGFGRWGSSDPWLGIPVTWGQISGARAIIEAQLPNRGIDLSQGSHFFHNISNLGVYYFSMPTDAPFPIQWDWLSRQTIADKRAFVTHVQLETPITIKVDGRTHGGIILK